MQRRLPVRGRGSVSAPDAWVGPRRRLPGVIGIADAARGLSALAFARDLSEAAHERGIAVQVTLLDFECAPSVRSAWAEGFAPHVAELRALRADAVTGPDVEAQRAPDAPLELWVGTPALVAFAPAFAVLLEAQRPPLEWPRGLRACAPECQLVLASAWPGLAQALVKVLYARGFLPAGKHSVR